MSVVTFKNQSQQSSQGELFLAQGSYIKPLVSYLASLYSTGKISRKTYNYLVREAYSQMLEQMIEQKVEEKLTRISEKIYQVSWEIAIADLIKKMSALSS